MQYLKTLMKRSISYSLSLITLFDTNYQTESELKTNFLYSMLEFNLKKRLVESNPLYLQYMFSIGCNIFEVLLAIIAYNPLFIVYILDWV